MRYLFVSDIHGEYDKLINALAEKNFNPQVDTLVTLGDLFDRGEKSLEVLEYVSALPNWIPILGNHEQRLKELMLHDDRPNKYDNYNGVPATLKSFTKGLIPTRYSGSTSDMQFLINQIAIDNRFEDVKKLIWAYFDKCVYAIEFADLVATHAWVPTNSVYEGGYCLRNEYWAHWRFLSNREVWDNATWSNADMCLKGAAFLPDKNLLVGHWHAWRIREKWLKETCWDCRLNDNGESETLMLSGSNDIAKYYNVIFIDGCSNIDCGKVNVFEYNTFENPILYDGYI